MINSKFDDYLKVLKADLEFKLDIELSYIDRKQEIHSIKLYKQIARIEGYLMYKEMYKNQNLIYKTQGN
jgi:hypothetical protein